MKRTLALVLLVLSLLSPVLFGPRPAASGGNGFYFVQISDTHIGDPKADADARTAVVVEAINALPVKVAFVLHTGDIVMDRIDDPAVIARAKELFSRLHAPIHCVPGNHDILARPARRDADAAAFIANFGPLAQRIDYGGVSFLLMDTEPLARNFNLSGYDGLAWLAEQLRQADGRPVIVVHHRPAVEDFYDLSFHPNWDQQNCRRFIDVLAGGNVRAIIAGHFHRDEMHFIGDIPVYVAGPVAAYLGRQGSFRLYHYQDGHLSYRTIYLEPDLGQITRRILSTQIAATTQP